VDFARFPGGRLVRQGLEDLAAGRETEAALLVLVGAPRLTVLRPARGGAGALVSMDARLTGPHSPAIPRGARPLKPARRLDDD